VSEHRALHERNVRQLDQVRRTREATAAASQVEQARRNLADEESDVQAGTRRLHDLRQGVSLQEQALADLEAEQATARREVEAEVARLDAAIAEARAKRQTSAASIPAPLLARYDRISNRRHDDALYPLRGSSCASCDTALPLQRRSMMARTGAIEVCEACGVLLYAAE
jgi:predicted  nucleic acid-binding Zn-ribbon protein